MITVTFYGVRGSRPVPGPSTLHYGGNTSCVCLTAAGHESTPLVFDGGTGLIVLGEQRPVASVDLFLSHLHYNHIQGIPFFASLFSAETEVRFYGAPRDPSFEEALRRQMREPYYPITLAQLPSRLTFREVEEGHTVELKSGFRVSPFSLIHPGGAFAYRAHLGEHRVVYCSDTSHFDEERRTDFIAFARDADLLIYDAFFDEAEYSGDADGEHKENWGHSSWEEACRIAEACGAKRLALYHHRDTRTDAALSEIERAARARCPIAFCAAEGITLEIGAVSEQHGGFAGCDAAR